MGGKESVHTYLTTAYKFNMKEPDMKEFAKLQKIFQIVAE